MADIIDDAQAVNELHQQISLERARKQAQAPAHFNGINCSECEEPVEPKRLELGFHICLSCAQLAEHKRKLHAR